MKNSLGAVALGVAALGAQAGQKSCAPDEVAVFSAQANAIVDCKPGKPIGQAYVHTGAPTVELGSSEQSDKNHSSPNSNLLSVAATNGGAALGATVETGDVLVRISAETQKDLKSVLLGLGMPVGDTGYILLSGTQHREVLAQYGKSISSTGVNIEAGVTNPLPGVQSFVVELAHARAGDKHLRTDVNQYSFTVEDVLRTIHETETERRTETRTTRTTTTVTEITDTHFRGGEMNTIRLGAKLPLGENTLGSVGVHYRNGTYSGKDTGATLGVTHYMPEYRANISVGVNNDGVVALGVQRQLSERVIGYLTATGKSGNYTGYAGINYTWGDKAINPGVMPNTGVSSLRTRTDTLFPGNASAGVRPSSLGKVVSETVVTEEVASDTDTRVRVVKKPETPENPEPEPENPDPAPIVGGAFASLSDMTVSDNGGFAPITVNAGGVTDSLGRTIVYSATGLPPGFSIDASTGMISGTYDSGGLPSFTITVTAQAVGSTKSATKQFTLTIRDDG